MVWREAGTDPLAIGSLPRVRATVVVERGAKARVVTAGDSAETVRGHALRDVFWPLLESLPVAFRGEDQEDLMATRVLGKRKEGCIVVSTDLSAATDYAPFELAEAVWTGVFDGLVQRGDLSSAEASYGLREVLVHLGPHEVAWPTGTGVSRRGWLMGHPLTWLTLNLAHCAILDMVGLLSCAVVKGDDALVYGPSENVRDYLEALEICGFVVNRSKTFFSTDRGVFCERLFRVGGIAVPTVPVKRICAPTVEEPLRGTGSHREMKPGASLEKRSGGTGVPGPFGTRPFVGGQTRRHMSPAPPGWVAPDPEMRTGSQAASGGAKAARQQSAASTGTNRKPSHAQQVGFPPVKADTVRPPGRKLLL
jgi:hypothetical protein